MPTCVVVPLVAPWPQYRLYQSCIHHNLLLLLLHLGAVCWRRQERFSD